MAHYSKPRKPTLRLELLLEQEPQELDGQWHDERIKARDAWNEDDEGGES